MMNAAGDAILGQTRPPLYSPISVQGQTVLITGATAGIGEATAWRFAEAGAKLVLLGRRTERLENLKKSLSEAFPSLPEIFCVTFDVQEIAKIADLPAVLPESHREVAAPDTSRAGPPDRGHTQTCREADPRRSR